MKKLSWHQSDLGALGIAEAEGRITEVLFEGTEPSGPWAAEETALAREAARQLRAYLDGRLRVFDLPLDPQGAEFEKNVWAALRTIPWGRTLTYGDIARQIGKPDACRAVGRANGRNRINIIIPCHRVIGADGRLTGYSAGLQIKERLLRLEGLKIGPGPRLIRELSHR